MNFVGANSWTLLVGKKTGDVITKNHEKEKLRAYPRHFVLKIRGGNVFQNVGTRQPEYMS